MGCVTMENFKINFQAWRRSCKTYLNPGEAIGTDDDQEGFHRRLLQVFRDSQADFAYEDWLTKHTLEDQKRIADFVDGHGLETACGGYKPGPSIGVREHVDLMLNAGSGPVVVDGLNGRGHSKREGPSLKTIVGDLVDVFTHQGRESIVVSGSSLNRLSVRTTGEQRLTVSKVFEDADFQNWGRGVDYVPRYTCIPSSTDDIRHIVSFAKANDMSVRAAGFRECSSSPTSTLAKYDDTDRGYRPLMGTHLWPQRPNHHLSPAPAGGNPDPQLHCPQQRVPRAQARRPQNSRTSQGCRATSLGQRPRPHRREHDQRTPPPVVRREQQVYLPPQRDHVIVEMTVGGTNGPICHGAGRQHPTLSDLVRKVEYVDCHGILLTVEDPAQLKAASGCFGLMRVITHLTLEFEPMSYVLMNPQKIPVVHAVPPPDDLRESTTSRLLCACPSRPTSGNWILRRLRNTARTTTMSNTFGSRMLTSAG